MLITGNVDEILSRSSLHQLQWCHVSSSSLLVGALWMPMGSLTRAFQTDWPVAGRPFPFASPSIYNLAMVRNGESSGERKLSLHHLKYIVNTCCAMCINMKS